MNSFQRLAIPDPADLRFGVSPKSLTTQRGLTIGSGIVYPELNFTLPPMFVDANTMPEVRRHYQDIIGGACRRTAELEASGLVVEFETLPPMTETPAWGIELTRILLDGMAEVVATPDHTHAVIAMAAMQAGKHVYLQKPLTHDVFEARTLAEASKHYKVTTQMGNQGHSSESIRRICEWIWDGAIGEVHEVQAWCDLTYYPWGHAYWSSKWGQRPKESPAVPATLNWDLWLGPARERTYPQRTD